MTISIHSKPIYVSVSVYAPSSASHPPLASQEVGLQAAPANIQGIKPTAAFRPDFDGLSRTSSNHASKAMQ